MTGTLYVVATPIGNLQDVTLRALEVLKAVDAVFCEDTRVTAKLMAHYGITTRLFAYHQHSDEKAVGSIARTLNGGMDIALVSDAGTPGINDPGGRLIERLCATVPGLRIVPIPGANAAISALSVSGFPADRYRYLGFIPHKKGRQKFLREVAECEDTVVFYESKHRILKTLEGLKSALADAGVPDRPMLLARELTKQFETLYHGTATEVHSALVADKVLGEFVIVLGPRR